MAEFKEFDKISRLSRHCVITEKIDGTNAQVSIDTADVPQEFPVGDVPWVAEIGNLKIAAGSRTRYITPKDDNFGFARWVQDNAGELWKLGPGRHYGEWWGSGIQRGYGLQNGVKRWSLFNVARWGQDRDRVKWPLDAPACCAVVPVVAEGTFTTELVALALDVLKTQGSKAAPGFMRPEGVVIWHEAARVAFKKTLEKDEEPKGASRG